ncbi:JmjC domain-containing protein [Kribbella endophytica]
MSGAPNHLDMPTVAALDDLIGPAGFGALDRGHRAGTYALAAGKAGRFSNLLSWPDLNEIVRRQRVSNPRLDLSLDGEVLQPSVYTRQVATARGSLAQLDATKLALQLRRGATLVLNSIDQEHPPIRSVRQGLEQAFATHVSVNCYVSWGTTHGFDLHWDDHDTVIFQINGRKRWQIHQPTREWPLHDDLEQPLRPTTQPAEDLLLTDGDVQYVPRGWWHDVTAVGEPSVHLTFSLLAPTGADVLGWLVHQAKEAALTRQNLPSLESQQEREAYAAALRNALDSHITAEHLKRYVDELEYNSSLDPAPSFPLIDPATQEIAQETRVGLATGRAKRSTDGSGVALRIAGRTKNYPASTSGFIDSLISGARPQLDKFADRAERSEIEAATRDLWQDGVVTLTNPGQDRVVEEQTTPPTELADQPFDQVPGSNLPEQALGSAGEQSGFQRRVEEHDVRLLFGP